MSDARPSFYEVEEAVDELPSVGQPKRRSRHPLLPSKTEPGRVFGERRPHELTCSLDVNIQRFMVVHYV